MADGNLHLADNLNLPLLHLMRTKKGGQQITFIGNKGSGKTNSLKIAVKDFVQNGWSIAIIDPMNTFRSLRDAGLPLLIAGNRKSADVRITVSNAAALAAFSFRERVSVIVDTSFMSPMEEIEVTQAFLEPLWNLIRRQDEDAIPQPYGVAIDEAHVFVPQVGKTEASDIIVDMSKRGRQLNLSMFLTTQRPASINKDFVNMSNLLVVHRVFTAEVQQIQKSLGQSAKVIHAIMEHLSVGQAMVKGDKELIGEQRTGYLIAQIYEWRAAESERFLAVMKGEEALRPISPAAIEALRKSMQSKHHVETFVSAEEAQKLRERIAELEAEVERLKAGRKPEAVEPVGIKEPVASIHSVPIRIDPTLPPGTVKMIAPPVHGVPVQVTTIHNVGLPEPEPTNGNIEPLSSGARKVLTKLADIYPMRVTRKQLATLTDYTDGGGAFNAIWSALKRNQLISDLADHVEITSAGFRYLGRQPRNVPLTHHELMQMWREVLPERTFEVLTIVVRQYPRAISLDDLALVVGMTAGGGGFNSHIGKLRLNNLIVKDKASGGLRANAESLKLNQ